MTTYIVGDIILASTIPLPELRPAGDEVPAWTFHLLLASPPDPSRFQPFHEWLTPEGELWLSLARNGEQYHLRFVDLADFLVDVKEGTILCYPDAGTPAQTVRHLLLDQVLPVLLSQPGRPVLHGSAVSTPAGAVAFLGSSGRGKSTLTASFALAGCPLMTDDCLLVRERAGEFVVVPSYPGVRLWPETITALHGDSIATSNVAHYTAKKRLEAGDARLPFADAPAVLRRVYLLDAPTPHGSPEEISITSVSGRDAVIELLSYTFRLGMDVERSAFAELDMFSRLVSLGIVRRLHYPRDISSLARLRAAILTDLQ